MSHFCVYVFHDENTTVDELLAPYDENIEFAPYVLYTKEQAIAKVRSEIEAFRNGIYKEYLADPDKYKENWGHSAFSYAVDFASQWDIGKLYLFHHEPTYDDKKIFSILQSAQWYAQYVAHTQTTLCLAQEGDGFSL